MNLHLFIIMSTLTILSPGPGVLKSLSNSLNYGFKSALVGICGLACGVFCVATLSATSLGALLAASSTAFTVIKYAGAGYLVYLGLKLWRAPAQSLGETKAMTSSNRKIFIEGFLLQFSNPKAIVFFLAVFPQFIDHSRAYAAQFSALVLTFLVLFVIIHSSYALFAQKLKGWFKSNTGGRWMNRIAGSAFIGFGVLLANSQKTI